MVLCVFCSQPFPSVFLLLQTSDGQTLFIRVYRTEYWRLLWAQHEGSSVGIAALRAGQWYVHLLRLRLRREIREKRNSDIAFQEINSIIWISAISATSSKSMGRSRFRETKSSLNGELELIEKALPWRSCKELPKKNWRIEKNLLRWNWSCKTRENWRIVHATTEESYDCVSDDGQIRDLQNKVNSLSGARALYDPELGSSSGATHVPDQATSISESQNLAALRFWIVAWYTER